jgi:hypothetical protein
MDDRPTYAIGSWVDAPHNIKGRVEAQYRDASDTWQYRIGYLDGNGVAQSVYYYQHELQESAE